MDKNLLYKEFIESIELNMINRKKIFFENHEEISFSRNNAMEMSLDIKESCDDWFVKDNHLVITKKYSILGKSKDEKNIEGEFIYRVFFSCKNMKLVEELKKDETLYRQFSFPQLNLYLWPYFREDVQSTASKTGINNLILPVFKINYSNPPESTCEKTEKIK